MAYNELKRVLDQVKPSREQEAAMLNRLLTDERTEHRMKKRTHTPRLAAAAAAVAIVLTSGAFAAVTGLDRRLLDYFGGDGAQEELLSATAMVVDKELTDEGATLHVRQVVADRYSVVVLMDFTAPEGTVLDGDFYKPDDFIELYGSAGEEVNTSWFSGWELVEDGDSSDNKITLLFTLNPGDQNGNLLGGALHFQFENLYRDNLREDLVLEGKWSGVITLPEEDPGSWYPIDRLTDIGGHSVKLSTLYVSPISLVCDLEEGAESLRTIKDTVWDGWKDGVALLTATGERIGVREDDYGMQISYYDVDRDPSDREVAHFYYRPEQLIDPAEITAVELFGQTVILKG